MATVAPRSGVRAFDSLFPSPSASAPTPITTPALGFPSEGESFGGPDVDSHGPSYDLRRNVTLSCAKRFLSNIAVLNDSLSPEGVEIAKSQLAEQAPKDIQTVMETALADWPNLPHHEEDLVDWYINALRNDFYSAVEPALNKIWFHDKSEKIIPKLQRSCEIVLYAQQIYVFPVTEYMLPALQNLSKKPTYSRRQSEIAATTATTKLTAKFSNLLQPVFIDTSSADKFYHAVTAYTMQSSSMFFRLDQVVSSTAPSKYEVHHEAGLQLMQIFEHLNHVGLGDEPALRAFAEAVEEVVVRFVHSKWMDVDWKGQKPVIAHLTVWVEKVLAPFINRGYSCLSGEAKPPLDGEVTRWLDMAIAWLGRSRITNLYSYVCAFPYSLGAIHDIKAYITTPEARKYLTTSFQQDVERKLLHAGATTKHILDVYILIIQTFITIDARGVLLDNVTRPVRKYLKSRQDTAKIIIASMLADTSNESTRNSPDVSHAITAEMEKPIGSVGEVQRQDYDLDFDNMSYLPQPNDASPDFVRNESNDAISHLLSLYDREQFVSVLKSIFGEHLLKTTKDARLEKETHLLRLFKSRFGDDKLQACDVMLQDIIDSRKMHQTINDLPQFVKATAPLPLKGAGLTAQILSSFFWPEMRDDEFSLPKPVLELQRLYEHGFRSQHNMMKLKWLPSLGRATVELQLEDRVVQENVPTWVASVIYAFDDSHEPALSSKSIDEIAEALEMEEPLVRNAISFWIGKRVLEEAQDGRFIVLESLPDESEHSSGPMKGMLVQEEVSAVKTAQDILEENADMYMIFVQGMLMNQGSMPIQRILMMLKIALPGGFPFGEPELKGLLQGMVDAGRLVQNGDSFGVKK